MIKRILYGLVFLAIFSTSSFAACGSGSPPAGFVCAAPEGTAGVANYRALGDGHLPSGINAAKIGGGSVSTTEYDRLNGITSFGQSLIDDTDATAARTTMGLVIGTNVQAFDADLTTWAGLSPSANAQSLVTAANYAAMRALLDLEAGVDFYSISAANAAFQPLDADLTTWAGLTPSANAQSLVTAANYAAMRALLDLEAGTDFLTPAAIAAAYQPLDSDLTSIAGLTTTAAGRSTLTFADPGVDRIIFWDDSADAATPIALADISTELAPATGDYLIIYGAEGDARKVNWSQLPGAGGGISSVSEDPAPVLGGTLGLNGNDITGTGNINITGDVQMSDDVIVGDDVLLGSGGVINFNAGDVTFTHSADAITMAGGVLIVDNAGLQIGASVPFSDSAGTLTLQNVDAIDATTETTIEDAIDTLPNLTSVQGHTVTLTGALIRSGAHSLTLTTTGSTNVTLPTTGTIATTAAATDTTTGLVELATPAEVETGTDTARAVTAAGVLAAISGKHTISVPASAMITETTTGCSSGSTETPTNLVMIPTKDCDGATQEGVQFVVEMPKSSDEGTLTARVDWTAASGSGNVIWLLSCLARSNDDAIDTAFGTEVSVTDTLLAALDLHSAPESGAITPGGTWAQDDVLWCRVQRDADAAGDTLNGVDAKIIGVRWLYTINTYTDD